MVIMRWWIFLRC